MSSTHFIKAALLTAVFVIAFTIAWESYWRNRGFDITYNDDEALWAKERRKVYKASDKATVFIGSSRIKFDLDIPTWESITGDEVVQLSMVGTSPRPLLHDLANDENFKGKLIIDITEGLFFERNTRRTEKSAVDGIKYYKEETPSQQASSVLNYGLESRFVFLEEGKFGLDELLKDLEVPNRPGVFSFPRFPKEFGLTTYRRQDYMNEKFLTDTSLQRRQCENWTKLGALSRQPGINGDSLITVFKEIKASVEKIRARGGQVIFVRTPASGAMEEATKAAYPRQQYWDKMLAYTATEGIHYEDYPETAKMICPEWSHLSSKDAVIYTKKLVEVLEKEKGWKFPHKPSSLIASN
jgi:hypothetical protein